LGEIIAKRLAAEGVWVVVTGRDEQNVDRVVDEIRQANGKADGVPADLSVPSEARRLADLSIGILSYMDILVNNAGMSVREPIWEVSEEHLDYQLNVDFRSYFVLAQAACKTMIPRRHGRIVNISTNGAFQAHPMTAVYDSSKGAVESLTRCLATELGRFNICANAVSPGYVPIRPGSEEDVFSQVPVDETIPLGRAGTADDVAAMVLFLCRPESSWISGQVIAVDGGRLARLAVPPQPEPPEPDF
jgi:3-oxoacyl-[acyl-carrier protein] reductase